MENLWQSAINLPTYFRKRQSRLRKGPAVRPQSTLDRQSSVRESTTTTTTTPDRLARESKTRLPWLQTLSIRCALVNIKTNLPCKSWSVLACIRSHLQPRLTQWLATFLLPRDTVGYDPPISLSCVHVWLFCFIVLACGVLYIFSEVFASCLDYRRSNSVRRFASVESVDCRDPSRPIQQTTAKSFPMYSRYLGHSESPRVMVHG